jgi:primosomal protein N' (replication factor Y)
VLEAVPATWTSVADVIEATRTTRATLRKLADGGHLELAEVEVGDLDRAATDTSGAGTDTAAAGDPSVAPQLTPAQLAAVEACADVSAGDTASLLMGVTGSGKTEVYLELIRRDLEAGRGAIVLVPEIALTPQTAGRFLRRFPGTVEVLHSAMTKGERRAAWERIARGKARVVVGPRSAVFAPVHDLGTIVVDEEHDGSYKQESDPRYDARRVAFWRAREAGARLVLGSATPRVESWHGIPRRVRLTERVAGGRLAPVELVDLGEHADTYPLTDIARAAIDQTLRRGRKAIVLHNRRGFANALHCRSCAHTFRCPNCDVSLVVHGRAATGQQLACHHCGHAQPVPRACPHCQSADVTRLGAGTERLERDLVEQFGERVHRLDADAVKLGGREGGVAAVLDAFARPGPSLLVGTQMIAKGHDFPDVETAVVIDADAALAIPDFRAEERAFSLTAQLAGRAGRAAATADTARVIVQTWDPQLWLFEHVKNHDVEGFLEVEVDRRRRIGYPPFIRLVRVIVSAPTAEPAQGWAYAVAEGLEKLAAGPVGVPAPLMRIAGRERTQVVLKTRTVAPVARAMRAFLRSTQAQRSRSDVRIVLDVDPQGLA